MNEFSNELIVSMLQEQFKAQAEQFKVQAATNAFLTEKVMVISDKLDRIEENVILIKGIVLSDFSGITASTKRVIEVAAEEALEEKEVIVGTKLFFDSAHPAFKTGVFKKVRQQIRTNSLGSLVRSYDPSYPNNKLSSIGLWVNAQLTKIFGETLNGKYDSRVVPLVSVLVGYYLTERLSNGRAF
jgi:hypothetical protein